MEIPATWNRQELAGINGRENKKIGARVKNCMLSSYYYFAGSTVDVYRGLFTEEN
jgi:hypothetical protein